MKGDSVCNCAWCIGEVMSCIYHSIFLHVIASKYLGCIFYVIFKGLGVGDFDLIRHFVARIFDSRFLLSCLQFFILYNIGVSVCFYFIL